MNTDSDKNHNDEGTPRQGIGERNIDRLIQEAYDPAAPRAEYVSAVEARLRRRARERAGRLAPALRRAAASWTWRRWGAAAAAAAAILIAAVSIWNNLPLARMAQERPLVQPQELAGGPQDSATAPGGRVVDGTIRPPEIASVAAARTPGEGDEGAKPSPTLTGQSLVRLDDLVRSLWGASGHAVAAGSGHAHSTGSWQAHSTGTGLSHSAEPGQAGAQPAASKEARRDDGLMRPKELAPAVAMRPAAVGETIETKAGQRRRVALADGSVLYLNAGTRVKVEADRRVALAKGEVYVEVAPLAATRAGPPASSRVEPLAASAIEPREGESAEPAKAAGGGLDAKDPYGTFVLSTPHRQVTALGTRFRVREDGGGTSVLVTQGRVKVSGLSDLLYAGSQLQTGGAEAGPRVVPALREAADLEWMKDLMRQAASPLVPASQYAGGALVAVDPRGQPLKLSLRKYHVDVYVEDGFARTTIDQTYFNDDVRRLEGTFYFPLPPDASLSRLAMYVDGKLMEGGMAERDYARKVYEGIVAKMKDPALLEWVDGSTFKMRVFPLEGRQEKRIILSYVQKLPVEYGRVEYRFPAGHSLEFVKDWAFHARVAGVPPACSTGILPVCTTGVPPVVSSVVSSVSSSSSSSSSAAAAAASVPPPAATAWASPSHQLQAKTDSADLLLDAHEANAALSRDVVLKLWDTTGETRTGRPPVVPTAEAPATFRAAYHEGAKYLMLRYRPALEARPRRERRDWIFLFESSGDRNPLLARAQVEVVRAVLENVEHTDRFAVLSAGTRTTRVTKGFEAATPKNVRAAIDALGNTHLVGALDLGQALAAALEIAKGGRNVHIVHLGSANPILGEKRQEALVKMLGEWRGTEEEEEEEEETNTTGKMPVVHTGGTPVLHKDETRTGGTPVLQYVGVGVGKKWNRSFMKAAAGKTGGYFTQINPDENIPWRGFELLSTLNTPRLMDVKVVDSAERSAFLCDSDFVSHGQELCAITRVEGAAPLPASVVVTGTLEGKPVSKVIRVTGLPEDPGAPHQSGAAGESAGSGKAAAEKNAASAGAGYLPRAWAKMEIDRLVDEGAEKNRARIVELSKSMYVMSPFTSLLVLENEQMYQQYNVDRGRKDHWAMYPCPPTIPVVTEALPAPAAPVVAAAPAPPGAPSTQPVSDAKKIEQVLSTVLVRAGPRMLRFRSEGAYYTLASVTAWQAITGAYAIPVDSDFTSVHEFNWDFNDYSYSPSGGAPGSVSELLFLLVRDGRGPGNFVAPGSSGLGVGSWYTVGPSSGGYNWDFSTYSLDGAERISYSYQAPMAWRAGVTTYFTSVSAADAWGRPLGGVGQIQLPNVTIGDLPTTVSIPDGGTLLQGGQWYGGELERESGAPLLSRIPIIRRLFSNSGEVRDEQTYLVLAKPRIIFHPEEDDGSFPGRAAGSGTVYLNGGTLISLGADYALADRNSGYNLAVDNGTLYLTNAYSNLVASNVAGAVHGAGNLTFRNSGTNLAAGNWALDSGRFANTVIRHGDTGLAAYSVVLDGQVTYGGMLVNSADSSGLWLARNKNYYSGGAYLSGGALTTNGTLALIGNGGYILIGAGPDMPGKELDSAERNRLGQAPDEIRRQVFQYSGDVKDAIHRKDYARALDLMDKILKIDPDNQSVKEQKFILQQVELLQREKNYSTDGDYQRQGSLIDIREAEIPWYELLRYPRDWREITALRAPLDIPDSAREVHVYPMINGDAADVARKISYLFDQNGRDAYRPSASVVADRTTDALIVAASAADQEQVRRLIKLLDEHPELAEGVLAAKAPRFRSIGNVLYERPVFSGDSRAFTDLLSYAPGMNTSLSDIQAVLEAEGPAGFVPAPGRIDPAADKIIEKARSAGWRSVTFAGREGGSDIVLTFDGAGRFTRETRTAHGLVEKVYCDGKTILHLYPELGVGARRTVSRFHRVELAAAIPMIVPPAEDLARGADVAALDARTVAVTPRGADGLLRDDGSAAPYIQVRLVFAEDGPLAERQTVAMPAGTVLSRETYAKDGTVRAIAGGGEEARVGNTVPPSNVLREYKLDLREAAGPDLAPDVSDLVILPMPIRTRASILQSEPARKPFAYDDMDPDFALRLLSADLAERTGQSAAIVGRRFLLKGDRRIGFYAILFSEGVDFGAGLTVNLGDGRNQRFDPRKDHPYSMLAAYMTERGTDLAEYLDALRHAGKGFVEDLAAFRCLHYRWAGGSAATGDEKARGQERDRAVDFAAKCHSPAMAWAVLAGAIDSGGDAAWRRSAAKVFDRLAAAPGLGYYARYESARALRAAGDGPSASAKFLDLYRRMLRRGVLPPIDGDFRSAFTGGDADRQARWTRLVRDTSAALLARGDYGPAIVLACQCLQLGEPAGGDLLASALAAAPKDQRPGLGLAVFSFLWRAGRVEGAETLLQPAMDDPAWSLNPYVWRLAWLSAQKQGKWVKAAGYLDKALDLEYRSMPAAPAAPDLQALRGDYAALMDAYQRTAAALSALDADAPRNLPARVIRAADRWRSMEADETAPCQAAARVLTALGEGELAWEYLTTPLAQKPNEAAPWVSMAAALRQQGDLALADRAYACAFEAEPTNAQILWDRAGVLQQLGRPDRARELYRRLAGGTWEARFEGLKTQARQQLHP